jgi:hypothetical protein
MKEKRLTILAVTLGVLAWHMGASLALSAEDPNAAPASLHVLTGGMATMTDADTAVTPTATIIGELPIRIGSVTPVRFLGSLGISSLPGEDLNIGDAATFRSADASLGLMRILGQHETGDQLIRTAVVAEWGWQSVWAGEDQEPSPRLARHYGVGARVMEEKTGSWAQLLIGRDEAVGERGWGQWIVSASVPVPLTDSIVRIVMGASLAIGPSRTDIFQRDIFRVGVCVDVARLGGILGGKK